MTRIGTAYFVDIVAARRYYAKQRLNARDVDDKIASGEIHVGLPPIKEGEKRTLIDNGTRWAIVEP